MSEARTATIPATPAEAGINPTPDQFDAMAFEAAAAADAARAEREGIQGQAMRAETARTETTLEERKLEHEQRIFEGAYQESVRGAGGTEQEIADRHQKAVDDARKAVEADRLWQQTFADKLRESGATHVADPTDPNDMFTAAAVDAANEAVAKFYFQARPRVDKIADPQRLISGAQAARQEAATEDDTATRELPIAGATPPPRRGNGNTYRGRLVGEEPDDPTPVTAPPANGGDGGNGGGANPPVGTEDAGNGNPPAREVLPANLKAAVDRVAQAKYDLERKVGFGKKKQIRELEEAQLELRELIKNQPGDPADKLELVARTNEEIALRQIELAPEDVRGFARFMQKVSNSGVVKFMKKHKVVGLTVAGVVVAGGLVAGALTGGAAAMAIGAGIGAVKGSAIGGGIAYAGRRAALAADNVKDAIRARVTPQVVQLTDADRQAGDYEAFGMRSHQAMYEGAQKYRDANGRTVAVGTAKGVGIGAVAGALAGASAGGYIHWLAGGGEVAGKGVNVIDRDNIPRIETPSLTPEEVESNIQGLLESDPSKIKTIPGLEGVTIDTVTGAEAAQDYPGTYPWDSLQAHAELSDGQTLNAFLNGWSELRDVPGVDIDTWGDVHLNEQTGEFETTGNTWGAEITTDHLYVTDADGNIHHFDGKLNNAQHAELLDLVRQDGAEVMNADQLAERLAPQVETNATAAVEAQVDGMAEELESDLAGDTNITQEEVQRSINGYVANHEQELARLSDPQLNEYLATRVAQETQAALGESTPQWVNPEAIQRMIDEAINAARNGADAS